MFHASPTFSLSPRQSSSFPIQHFPFSSFPKQFSTNNEYISPESISPLSIVSFQYFLSFEFLEQLRINNHLLIKYQFNPMMSQNKIPSQDELFYLKKSEKLDEVQNVLAGRSQIMNNELLEDWKYRRWDGKSGGYKDLTMDPMEQYKRMKQKQKQKQIIETKGQNEEVEEQKMEKKSLVMHMEEQMREGGEQEKRQEKPITVIVSSQSYRSITHYLSGIKIQESKIPFYESTEQNIYNTLLKLQKVFLFCLCPRHPIDQKARIIFFNLSQQFCFQFILDVLASCKHPSIVLLSLQNLYISYNTAAWKNKLQYVIQQPNALKTIGQFFGYPQENVQFFARKVYNQCYNAIRMWRPEILEEFVGCYYRNRKNIEQYQYIEGLIQLCRTCGLDQKDIVQGIVIQLAKIFMEINPKSLHWHQAIKILLIIDRNIKFHNPDFLETLQEMGFHLKLSRVLSGQEEYGNDEYPRRIYSQCAIILRMFIQYHPFILKDPQIKTMTKLFLIHDYRIGIYMLNSTIYLGEQTFSSYFTDPEILEYLQSVKRLQQSTKDSEKRNLKQQTRFTLYRLATYSIQSLNLFVNYNFISHFYMCLECQHHRKENLQNLLKLLKQVQTYRKNYDLSRLYEQIIDLNKQLYIRTRNRINKTPSSLQTDYQANRQMVSDILHIINGEFVDRVNGQDFRRRFFGFIDEQYEIEQNLKRRMRTGSPLDFEEEEEEQQQQQEQIKQEEEFEDQKSEDESANEDENEGKQANKDEGDKDNQSDESKERDKNVQVKQENFEEQGAKQSEQTLNNKKSTQQIKEEENKQQVKVNEEGTDQQQMISQDNETEGEIKQEENKEQENMKEGTGHENGGESEIKEEQKQETNEQETDRGNQMKEGEEDAKEQGAGDSNEAASTLKEEQMIDEGNKGAEQNIETEQKQPAQFNPQQETSDNQNTNPQKEAQGQ